MDVQHTDKSGKPWAFSIDCTPYQCEILKRALASVRNIGNREALALKYYEDFEANEFFCRELERVLLAALAGQFPVHEQAPQEKKKPQEPEPIRKRRRKAAPGMKKAAIRKVSAGDPEEESERITYYWENF